MPESPVGPRIFEHLLAIRYHSHSLTSSFPQLLFALFWANFREFSLVLLRFSLYFLCSQPDWYCFGIKVWYQFFEKIGGEKIRYSFPVSDTWLCPTVQLALMFGYKGGCKGRVSSWSKYIIAGKCKKINVI